MSHSERFRAQPATPGAFSVLTESPASVGHERSEPGVEHLHQLSCAVQLVADLEARGQPQHAYLQAIVGWRPGGQKPLGQLPKDAAPHGRGTARQKARHLLRERELEGHVRKLSTRPMGGKK